MTYKRTLAHGASRLAAAFVLASIGLAGCNQNASNGAVNGAPSPLAALPMTNDVAAPIEPAPPASALPAAPPARLGSLSNPSDRYAFADRAYAANSGFGNAPPDYTFQYSGGERPWVWRGDDQSTRVAEPLPGGGYRYYYYDPGASEPYLVRDPDYSYGYNGGVLVVVYDSQGRPVPPGMMQRQADIAGRFLYWAAAIYAASQQQQHEAVAEANWAAQRSAVDAERAQWEADQAADQDWAAYHAAHEQEEDAHWDAERYRRESEAVRFDITINDTQAAQRDTQAAQQAQSRAAAAGQPVGQPRAGFAPAPAAPVASPPPRPYPVAPVAAQPSRPYHVTPVAAQPSRPYPAAPVAAQPSRPYPAAPVATRPSRPYPAAPVTAQPPRSRPAAGAPTAHDRLAPTQPHGPALVRPGPAVTPPAHGENAAAQATAARANNEQARQAAEQAAQRPRQAKPPTPAAPVVRPEARPAVRPAAAAPKAATSPEPKPPKSPRAKPPGPDDHGRPDP